MLITSIDVGYNNVGLVVAECTDDEIDVKLFKKIDLTIMKHNTVDVCNCKIPHTNELSDLVAHFVQEYSDFFNMSDKILIERQPPGGLTNVQTLLHYIFRDKVELISPTSMHKHFGIGHLDYENRKLRTVEISSKYIDFKGLIRKHDVADAMCMIIFYDDINKKNNITNPFQKFLFRG